MAVYAMRVIGAGLRLEIAPGWPGLGEGFHAREGNHCWTNGSGILSTAMLTPFEGDVTIETDGHGLERYRAGRATRPITRGTECDRASLKLIRA